MGNLYLRALRKKHCTLDSDTAMKSMPSFKITVNTQNSYVVNEAPTLLDAIAQVRAGTAEQISASEQTGGQAFIPPAAPKVPGAVVPIPPPSPKAETPAEAAQ